jgi:hypothetical protein
MENEATLNTINMDNINLEGQIESKVAASASTGSINNRQQAQTMKGSSSFGLG